MSLASELLPEFDIEMANTRKVLANLPEEHLAYKPHDKSMTLGRLAGHVAEMPQWGLNALASDSLDITPQPGQTFEAMSAKSRDQLLAFFDENVAKCRAALADASDEYLRQIWRLYFKGQAVVTQPRITVLRSMVMNHMIHHRAQLGVFYRLNNVPVPGVYGPSADEPRPMMMAQA